MFRPISLISVALWQTACVSPASNPSPYLAQVVPIGMSTLVWSPDGKYFASGMADQTISIWDADSGKVTQTLRGHELEIRDDGIRRPAYIYCSEWSPDGKYLASASSDQTIRIWDTNNGQQVNMWRGPSEMKVVAWSPDGSKIAVGGSGNKVTVLDLKSLTPVLEFHGHTQYVAVRAIAWSTDGKKCATGGGVDNIRIWDSTSGDEIAVLTGHGRIPNFLLSRQWPAISSLAWSPDGSLLASSANDWTCRIWDIASFKQLQKLRHGGPVGTTRWSGDGKYLATVCSEAQRRFGRGPTFKPFVRIWDPKDGSRISKLEGGMPTWNPIAAEFALANHRGAVDIWSLQRQDEPKLTVTPRP